VPCCCDHRIRDLIDQARRKDVIAAWAIGLVCVVVGAMLFWRATDTTGMVFGFLFFLVGAMGGLAVYRLDGGKLKRLWQRLQRQPELVVWLHESSVANRLRRGEASVFVFFMDRTYVRVTLPKARASELMQWLIACCPQARQTRELSLSALLELELQWRKDPAAFRSETST